MDLLQKKILLIFKTKCLHLEETAVHWGSLRSRVLLDAGRGSVSSQGVDADTFVCGKRGILS